MITADTHSHVKVHPHAGYCVSASVCLCLCIVWKKQCTTTAPPAGCQTAYCQWVSIHCKQISLKRHKQRRSDCFSAVVFVLARSPNSLLWLQLLVCVFLCDLRSSLDFVLAVLAATLWLPVASRQAECESLGSVSSPQVKTTSSGKQKKRENKRRERKEEAVPVFSAWSYLQATQS